jgi:hypothetical protein
MLPLRRDLTLAGRAILCLAVVTLAVGCGATKDPPLTRLGRAEALQLTDSATGDWMGAHIDRPFWDYGPTCRRVTGVATEEPWPQAGSWPQPGWPDGYVTEDEGRIGILLAPPMSVRTDGERLILIPQPEGSSTASRWLDGVSEPGSRIEITL